MAEYDNTNRGVLFRNDRKDSEKHPDHTGAINVDGKEFRLSAWVKDGKKGRFFSLSVRPVETTGQRYEKRRTDVAPEKNSSHVRPQIDSDDEPFNDDIPF